MRTRWPRRVVRSRLSMYTYCARPNWVKLIKADHIVSRRLVLLHILDLIQMAELDALLVGEAPDVLAGVVIHVIAVKLLRTHDERAFEVGEGAPQQQHLMMVHARESQQEVAVVRGDHRLAGEIQMPSALTRPGTRIGSGVTGSQTCDVAKLGRAPRCQLQLVKLYVCSLNDLLCWHPT